MICRNTNPWSILTSIWRKGSQRVIVVQLCNLMYKVFHRPFEDMQVWKFSRCKGIIALHGHIQSIPYDSLLFVYMCRRRG